MKKLIAVVLAAALALSLTAVALADTLTIAVPNDPTNEGRALLLLEDLGVITLKEDAGITASKADIATYNKDIELVETDAAMLPNQLADVDYAIINNNFALDAGLSPANDGLAIEDANSPYVNVLSVKEENADTDLTRALVAAITSQQVGDWFAANYPDGSAVFTVAEPTNGYDDSVDYAALAGTTVLVGATPEPHQRVLEDVVAPILAEKGITLEVMVFTDYVMPNTSLEDGSIYANYFAHTPYQENFNAENGTHIANVAGVHVEPMALYGGKQTDLTALVGE